MKVGILGSSDVAKSLARGFLNEGHEVMLGSREPEKLASWVQESGDSASSGTFSETATFGELVVLAVNGAKSVEAVQIAGVDNFNGKVVSTPRTPWICPVALRPSSLAALALQAASSTKRH
jgi:hypothetical protein